MKRITAFIATLLSFFIHQPAHAQKAGSDDKSLLWRISGKNLSKPSYLFGTIHMICTDDYLWTNKMKESLANSEKICFEMDLDDPKVMMEVAAGLMDNTGKQLKDYFTPAQYKMVQHYFKDSLGLDLSMMQQLKPVALQTMMTTGSMTCTNSTSYEDSIMKTAIAQHKEILGLEEPKEQIAVLESMPVDTVIQQILDVVENKSKSNDQAEFNDLVAAYKTQDLPKLYDLIANTKDASMDMGAFLDDRNKKWILRMPAKMDKASVFFAVGAGHLYGNNGVINLLRKDGYAVEAVR